MKAGIFRLSGILLFLTAVFAVLTLISLKRPGAPLLESALCPFVLAVSPPLALLPVRLTQNRRLTKSHPKKPRNFIKKASFSLENRPDLYATARPSFIKAGADKNRSDVSGRSSEIPETAELLHDTRFFSTVLSRAGDAQALQLVFYLPLHLTRDNRWLVSDSSFALRPARKQNADQSKKATALSARAAKNPPHTQTAKRFSTDSSGPSLTQVPPQGDSAPSSRFQAPEKISRLTLREIQEGVSPTKALLTLKYLLSRFPEQKWFLHFFTENREEALKSLEGLFEKKTIPYITSNNEKLLQGLSEKPTALIYGFRTLVRSQLSGIFLPKKLVSFPGRGVAVPSTLPLSAKRMKKLNSAGQQIFLHWETGVANLPRQKLREAKGLITREWRPALRLLENNSPCL